MTTSRQKRGPKKKPIERPDYAVPKRISRVKRSYSERRKMDVLTYIENHRIPVETNFLGEPLLPNSNTLLNGKTPVEPGFRRPFLREAAEHFGINNIATVQRWWALKDRPAKRPCAARWPKLEAKLYAEFCAAREQKRLVHHTWFTRRAKVLFKELYPNSEKEFSFSMGWFRGFLRRHRISHRRVTHHATKKPNDVVKIANEFLQFIRRNSRKVSSSEDAELTDNESTTDTVSTTDSPQEIAPRFPNHLIVNLDETPLPFESTTGFTYEKVGARSVRGRSNSSGGGSRQATLVLSILADGSFAEELKPTIIFRGTRPPASKEVSQYHDGVVVKFNEKAYNNEELMEEWIRTKLAKYSEGKDCLLVMDVVSFHKTEKVKTALKENNILPAMIPPGLTSYLQPLDVGFNGPFKSWLREESDLYEERLQAEDKLPEKWTVGQRRIMMTHIVGNAWKRAFTDEMKAVVTRLFVKTGISVHPDGRDDHLINIEGIDSSLLRPNNWRRLGTYESADQDGTEASKDEREEFVDETEVLEQPPDYRSMNKGELCTSCRNRGLSSSGNKAQMVKRLEDDDIDKGRVPRPPTPTETVPTTDAAAGDPPAGEAPTGDASTSTTTTGGTTTGDAPTSDVPMGDAPPPGTETVQQNVPENVMSVAQIRERNSSQPEIKPDVDAPPENVSGSSVNVNSQPDASAPPQPPIQGEQSTRPGPSIQPQPPASTQTAENNPTVQNSAPAQTPASVQTQPVQTSAPMQTMPPAPTSAPAQTQPPMQTSVPAQASAPAPNPASMHTQPPVQAQHHVQASAPVQTPAPANTKPPARPQPTAPTQQPPAHTQPPMPTHPSWHTQPDAWSQPQWHMQPPMHTQPPNMYNQQYMYNQPPNMYQQPIYNQPPVYNQAPMYGQSPMYTQTPVYNQPPVSNQTAGRNQASAGAQTAGNNKAPAGTRTTGQNQPHVGTQAAGHSQPPVHHNPPAYHYPPAQPDPYYQPHPYNTAPYAPMYSYPPMYQYPPPYYYPPYDHNQYYPTPPHAPMYAAPYTQPNSAPQPNPPPPPNPSQPKSNKPKASLRFQPPITVQVAR